MSGDRTEGVSPPSLLRWMAGIAASAGLMGMLCCVAPMVLFMMGIMSGVYAISFADFFYQPDGTPGAGAWALRVVAVVIGVVGVWWFRRQQSQCSLDPKRQRTNTVLLTGLVAIAGVGCFLTLEAMSSWYFDAYIVPAQQAELEAFDAANEASRTVK